MKSVQQYYNNVKVILSLFLVINNHLIVEFNNVNIPSINADIF